MAVSQAGLLPAPVHYSPAEAVSSQSYVRHEQPQAIATKLVAAPVAKYTVAAPVSYHASPVHYSSAESVSSQSIVRHEEPTKYLSAPVAKIAVAAPVYHSAPAPVTYHSAPTHVAYHAAPVAKVVAQPEEIVSCSLLYLAKCKELKMFSNYTLYSL